MRRWVAIAAVGVVALAGCTSEDGDAGSTGTDNGTAASSSADDPTSSAAEDAPSAPAGDADADAAPVDAVFGEAFASPDGLEVTVGTPETFTPSATALKGGEPDYVIFEVTVENGTSEAVVPADFTVTVQSGGGQGGDILDPESDISGPPTDPVTPGSSVSWLMAFGVLDARDVVVDVSPGIDAESVTFGR